MDREELKQRILGSGEFIPYLIELVEAGRIEDDIALGISKFIISNGTKQLTDKQWYTFLEKGIMKDNYVECCDICAMEIPWSEMFIAVYFYEDSYCSYCRQVHKMKNN